jgi:hypothetical protein
MVARLPKEFLLVMENVSRFGHIRGPTVTDGATDGARTPLARLRANLMRAWAQPHDAACGRFFGPGAAPVSQAAANYWSSLIFTNV